MKTSTVLVLLGALAASAFAAPADFNAATGYGALINGDQLATPALSKRTGLQGPFFDPDDSEIQIENIALVSESTDPDTRQRLGFSVTLRNAGAGYYEEMDLEFEPMDTTWRGSPVPDLLNLPDLPPHGTSSRAEPFEILVPAANRDAAVADLLAGKRMRPKGRELYQFTLPAVPIDAWTESVARAPNQVPLPGELLLEFGTVTPLLAVLTPGTLLVESPPYHRLARPGDSGTPPPYYLSSSIRDGRVFNDETEGLTNDSRKTKIVEVLGVATNSGGVTVRGRTRRLEDVLVHATIYQRPLDAYDNAQTDPYFPPLGENARSQFFPTALYEALPPRHKDRIVIDGFRAMHFPINDVVLFGSIKLDGQILLDALNIEIKARFRGRSPTNGFAPKRVSFKVASKAELHLRLSADARADNTNQALQFKEKELFNIPLPRLTVAIADIPIEFEPNLRGKIGAEINTPTKVVIPVQAALEIGAILSWDDARPQGQKFHYTPFHKTRPLTMSDPLVNNSLAFTASVFAEAALDVQINHLAGPYLAARATATFTANPANNPWWSLDLGAQTISRFRMSLFGLNPADVGDFISDVEPLFHKDPAAAVSRGSGAPGGTAPGSYAPVAGGETRWARKAGTQPAGMKVARVLGTTEDVFAMTRAGVVTPPILRLGPTGEIVWAKGAGLVAPTTIAPISGGGVAFAGEGSDGFFGWLDGNGNLITSRNFRPTESNGSGKVFHVASVLAGSATGGSGYFVVGNCNQDLVTLDSDPFIIKFDQGANIVWFRRYVSQAPLVESIAEAIIMPGGDLVLCGRAAGNRDGSPPGAGSEYGGLLMRVSPTDGAVRWASRALTGNDFHSVTASTDGTIFTGGVFNITVVFDWPTMLITRHNSTTGTPDALITIGENMAGANPVVPGVTRDWLPQAGLTPYDSMTKVIWTPNGLVATGTTIGYFTNGQPGLDPATRAQFVMCFSEQLSLRWWTAHDSANEDYIFDLTATDQGIFTAGSSLGFGTAPGGSSRPAIFSKLPFEGRFDMGPTMPGISKYLLPSVMSVPPYGAVTPNIPSPDLGYDGQEAIDYTVTDQSYTTSANTLPPFVDVAVDYSGPIQKDPRDQPAARGAGTTTAEAMRDSAIIHGYAHTTTSSGSARFEWGLAADALTNVTAPTNVPPNSYHFDYSDTLTGLAQGTTYHYRARLDVDGLLLYGSTRSFVAQNNAPVAADDVGLLVPGPGPTVLPVLANDTDADGDALTLTATTAPVHGTVTIAADGRSVRYDPDNAFRGDDTFSYTVSDGEAQDTAFVHLAVGCERTPLPVLTLLATTGMPVPDASVVDSSITSFGTPAISDSGAIVATMTTRTRRVLGSGIFFQDSLGNTSCVAQRGARVPGMPGVAFVSFGDPAISPGGAIAFTARIGGRGIRPPNNDGLWTNAGGGLRRLIAEGGALPFLGAARVSQILSFSLRDGELLTLLTLTPGNGVNATNDTVLVRIGADGNGDVVARKGSAVGGGDNTVVSHISALFSAFGSRGHGRTHSDAGSIAKLTTIPPRHEKLVAYAPDGTPFVLLSTGDNATAVGTGVKWDDFGLPALDTSGVAYVARTTLTPGLGGVTSLTDTALLFSDFGAAAVVIAVEDDPAPGTLGAQFDTFLDPLVNSDLNVAFAAALRGPGVTRTNAVGIWAGDPAAPALIARSGADATDANGQPLFGTTWSAFSTQALPGCGGGPVFLATLTGAGVTAANRTGLWAQDSTGLLRQLLRTGDGLHIGGRNRVVAAISLLSAGNGPLDVSRSFNSSGTLAARLTFTDRTQALVRIDVP